MATKIRSLINFSFCFLPDNSSYHSRKNWNRWIGPTIRDVLEYVMEH